MKGYCFKPPEGKKARERVLELFKNTPWPPLEASWVRYLMGGWWYLVNLDWLCQTSGDEPVEGYKRITYHEALLAVRGNEGKITFKPISVGVRDEG